MQTLKAQNVILERAEFELLILARQSIIQTQAHPRGAARYSW